MIKRIKVTAALVAVGAFVSLGYAAVAQQNPTSDQPTTQPGVQQNQTPDQQNQTPDQPTTQPAAQPTNRSTTQPNGNRLSAMDRQFMIKAAQGGMAEVIFGRLAAERAVNDNVKQFGQRMVQEHTQANSELMQLATQKGVTLPTNMDAAHKALRARIGQIPGKRFDRMYMNSQVADHRATVALFRRQAQQSQDPDLKAFAARMLPTIQDHFQMATSMTGSNTAQNQNRMMR